MKTIQKNEIVAMAKTTIEMIPERTRWETATKRMTGAYTAISNALKDTVRHKKFDQFNGPPKA